MGSAYTLAHKEGHNHSMYKKYLRHYVGNFFENWLGIFFGNVPYNFTTSHVFIHHRVNGGIGDTFYEWDIDRTSLFHFTLYIHRVFLHVIGYTSIKLFWANGKDRLANLLTRGVVIYILAAVGILVVTHSISFVFWVYLQPLLCMTCFLALMNIGFHGFIEFDADGKNIPCVNSTTIIEGDDDSFGEDDHMAHHYNSNVYFRDLPAHQQTKIEEFKQFKASVFKGLSIVELSVFILLRLWDKLADHYVDFSGTLSREEVKTMLRQRAQRVETSFEKYHAYLMNPTCDPLKPYAPSSSVSKDD